MGVCGVGPMVTGVNETCILSSQAWLRAPALKTISTACHVPTAREDDKFAVVVWLATIPEKTTIPWVVTDRSHPPLLACFWRSVVPSFGMVNQSARWKLVPAARASLSHPSKIRDEGPPSKPLS